MNEPSLITRKRWFATAVGLLVIIVVVAASTYGRWMPLIRGKVPSVKKTATDSHAGHDHGPPQHAGHVEESAIELSATGLKNIDFKPIGVAISDFERSISLPAIVVERPGHSQTFIAAPLTGVITRIYPVEGAAIEPGSPMFDVRLTHEELVAAQRSFLQSLEGFDLVQREIERLVGAGDGVIAGRRIIDQEYEQQKLKASLRADEQALILHGITQEQIDTIKSSRHLIQSMTVFAPVHADDTEACVEKHLFHVQSLPVKLGEHVEAGQLLCVVADHCELYIEGRAFEDDAIRLREALREGRSVTASVVVGRQQTDVIEGLQFLYLSDHIDADTRAFRFYVSLPNKVALDQVAESGRRFIAWRFNPGQRMQLRVPVEVWPNRIVLPVAAVIEEGAENFVYEQNGNHFDRVAVHVEFRDQTSVVIANDGAISPGDIVAAKGAYQMHLALKNKAGGGVDPHAGHNH